jgi:hypothetical protein
VAANAMGNAAAIADVSIDPNHGLILSAMRLADLRIGFRALTGDGINLNRKIAVWSFSSPQRAEI